MISLKPILFYSFIELLIALAVGASVLFWKWWRLKKDRQSMEKLWIEAKDFTEASLAELEHKRETGGSAIAHKIECLVALKTMFDQELMAGLNQSRGLNEAIMLALGQMEQEGEEKESKAKNLVPEPESEPARPKVDNYQEMESLISEQKIQLIGLQQYESELADLIRKSHQLSAANDTLLDCLKNVASTDENPQALLETLDTLQQYRQEMQSMIVTLNRESNQIEPKIKALEVQNQQLLTYLNSYRIKMENTDGDRKMELKDEIDELKKNLEMRDKSISRMHDKYEILRREYIMLYKSSTEGKKPKSPPIVK